MQAKIIYLVFGVIGMLLAILGCEEKFNINQLPDPGQPVTVGDTNYVEILPRWTGFESPRNIIIGNDQLIYVTDYDRNQLVMMDAAGVVLDIKSIPHPLAVSQNSKLDLYVTGEMIAPNGTDTIGAIYRIYLVRFDTTYIDSVYNPNTGLKDPVRRDSSTFFNHRLSAAPTHIVWKEAGRPRRRYYGISVMPGNDYLVARAGDDNSSFVDPDTRVLWFTKGDTLVTPLGDLVTRSSGGTAITDINQLTGLTTFPSSRDFILLQSNEGSAYGAIWMMYQSTADFQGWIPKYDPSKADQRSVDFIRKSRFRYPTAVAIDRKRRDIFIVDSALDSVSKFDRNGRFRTESFGRFKSASADTLKLNHPSGIAFSNDCTLYIADTGNKIIRRFKLSIQTQCN